MKYGYGCKPSKMDGTEHKYEYTKTQLPLTYNYVSVMPPVTDQGSSSKCVCHALTAYLDWNKNQFEGDNNGGQFDIDALYDIRSDKKSKGMQIKEALHFLLHTGLNGVKIEEYALVGSEVALQNALILNGPCPLALPVKSEDKDITRVFDKLWSFQILRLFEIYVLEQLDLAILEKEEEEKDKIEAVEREKVEKLRIYRKKKLLVHREVRAYQALMQLIPT